MEWYILLQLVMLAPHQGNVIIAGDQHFASKEMCDEDRIALERNLDPLIKQLLGTAVRYKDARMECKEVEAKGTDI